MLAKYTTKPLITSTGERLITLRSSTNTHSELIPHISNNIYCQVIHTHAQNYENTTYTASNNRT